MNNREAIQSLLQQVRHTEESPLIADEEAIAAEYEKSHNDQSLGIKILSIFGGLLASVLFLGALGITGLYDSTEGLLLFGTLFIGGAILASRLTDHIIVDTASVSAYLLGLVLLGAGLGSVKFTEFTICTIISLIAIGALCIVRDYIFSFISVLIVHGCISWLTMFKGAPGIAGMLYIALLSVILLLVYLKEAKLIADRTILSLVYRPVRAGLLVAFLSGLAMLNTTKYSYLFPRISWLASVVITGCIIWLIALLTKNLQLKPFYRIGIYILCLIILAPTALAPGIAGGLLVILLGFLVNDKAAFVLGIVAFIYFVSRYYYDLNFTLLTKSILLFSSGIVFLLLYLFTHKKLTAHEEV
ncbi:MAG: DUF4401 domain-containing protein [Candidatus Pseudobacter hemicellulosilyticus]|uniref:DUF4401 domain-containing protein n=1 Tax=Candidatus Pseudobacter hemicellulosilyticus TaxID=3121375 RepID=A0AAJ6BIE7_9BACT|nr:MAG: DUF4401 domain-containing protein [Pseudobacter sp.]